MQSGSYSTGSEDEGEEEHLSKGSMADSAQHPRLQMSRHLSGLVSPKANGGQTKGGQANGTNNYEKSPGRAPKGGQANVGTCQGLHDSNGNRLQLHLQLPNMPRHASISLHLLHPSQGRTAAWVADPHSKSTGKHPDEDQPNGKHHRRGSSDGSSSAGGQSFNTEHNGGVEEQKVSAAVRA
jgi:hypothetical protein